VNSSDRSGIAAAAAACAAAEACVLLLGIDGSVENEMRDRSSIDLPATQHALAAAVAAAGAAGVATSRVAVAPACEAQNEGAGARETKVGENREGIGEQKPRPFQQFGR
jgi:hypothetical protein